MTPEELLHKLKEIENSGFIGKETMREMLIRQYDERIELIRQAKKEWCKLPSEKEIDKKRKEKRNIYMNASIWNRYSEGFIDAINWLRNLNAPEPE